MVISAHKYCLFQSVSGVSVASAANFYKALYKIEGLIGSLFESLRLCQAQHKLSEKDRYAYKIDSQRLTRPSQFATLYLFQSIVFFYTT